jgi:hypothetical protein
MTPTAFLGETQNAADFWVKVDNNARLDTIWLEIKPPGYTPADPGGTGQVQMELIRSAYQVYNESLDRYEWTAQSGFEVPGAYQVFYFAKDRDSKNVSSLRETRVYKAKVGNQPPAVFALLSPNDGAEVLTTAVLDWEDTVDPDGDPVSYTVLLSKGDPGFWEPIRIEGLMYSTCLVGPADGIEDLSEYYWKVQAIDGYGAIRETDTWVFHTNNTNPVTAWVRGHVYDAGTMEPITAAVVSVGGVALNTALGGYYLGEVSPGTYGMTASANGYDAGSYSTVELGQGTLVTKNFALVPSGTSYPGDIDGNGRVDLGDAIIALKVLAGMDSAGLIRPTYPNSGADVDGDQKVGSAEAVYVMQEISGTR